MPSDANPTPQPERVGAVLVRARVRHAGLVVGVRWSQDESAYWHRGRLPDGPQSIVQIGSITKVFTTTLLADLARERLVDLDDPVQRHLPQGVRMPKRGRAITLLDLATHHSGLPTLPKGMLVAAYTRDRRDPYAKLDRVRLENAIAATQPRREPGRRFVYSNYGMGLLGHVLALRAGTTYERLVRTRICEPLGLDDTWIDTPAAKLARVAVGHNRRGRETPHWNLAALAGGGGLSSTAADLLAFLGLHGDGPNSTLAAAARETHRWRAHVGAIGVGLGWLILPRGSGPRWRRLSSEVLMHEGGTGGFRSFAAVVPETGTAIVVLANQAREVSRLGMQVLHAVIG